MTQKELSDAQELWRAHCKRVQSITSAGPQTEESPVEKQRRIRRRLCLRRLSKPREPFAHGAFRLLRARPGMPAACDSRHDEHERRQHCQPLLPRPFHRNHLAFVSIISFSP